MCTTSNYYFYLLLKDNKMHAVRVYKYIAGETMKSTKVDSKVSTDFGSYVGNLSLTLKVIISFLLNI